MGVVSPAHTPGMVVFALTMIGLGVLGLSTGDFTPVWAPVPKGAPIREWLVYLTAVISLVCGAGLPWRRTAVPAAGLLLAALVIWLLRFRVPNLFLAPASQDSWSGLGETAVIVAGAWVVFAGLTPDWGSQRFRWATGETGLRIARTLFGVAMIIFGEAHFRYLEETAGLVPGWLPWPLAWACFTGGAYILAGLAIVVGVRARLAAALCALQMGLFTALVWLPIMAAGHANAFQRSETIISWALTAAAWMVADSYRDRRTSPIGSANAKAQWPGPS
jgi:uncharacterized membrane protein